MQRPTRSYVTLRLVARFDFPPHTPLLSIRSLRQDARTKGSSLHTQMVDFFPDFEGLCPISEFSTIIAGMDQASDKDDLGVRVGEFAEKKKIGKAAIQAVKKSIADLSKQIRARWLSGSSHAVQIAL